MRAKFKLAHNKSNNNISLPLKLTKLCTLYIWANSFMSTILTFILFFVYFPLCGRKTYLGSLGDNGAGSRKIYYWDLFARAPSTDIAKAKVMNDTCFEILPAVNCFPRNFIGWEVYLSWNMWEHDDFYNATDQAIFLLFGLYCRAIRLKGASRE